MLLVDTTVSSTHASTRLCLERRRHAAFRARLKGACRQVLLAVWLLCLLVLAPPTHAREPEVQQMALQRTAEGLYLSARLALEPTPAVEDALLKGVPLYFVWQADVMRERWYWTDKRLASVMRTWRLAYQPLTRRWRLSLSNDSVGNIGGAGLQYALHQNFESLSAALASVGRVARWRVADAGRLGDGSDERVEFSFRLDLTLLPRPFQIGMANHPEWVIELQRQLDVPRQAEPDGGAADPAANAAR